MVHKIRLGKREIKLPQSKAARVTTGVALVLGGLLGWLPILGFWMLPLGLLVLSIDVPVVRRWRRRNAVWFARRFGKPGTR